MNCCNCFAGLKAIAEDLTGLNTLFTIYSAKEFARESEDSITRYVSDQEKVIFYLKSGTKKLIFTDLALIYFIKSASTSFKAKVIRFPYALCRISDISMTTGSGLADGDFELEFKIGTLSFTFEDRSEVNILKTNFGDGIHVFNALSVLSAEQRKRDFCRQEVPKEMMQSYLDILSPYAKAIDETGISVLN